MRARDTRLVLLHPAGLSSAMWDLVAGLDPDKWEIVRHDFRGHGSSPRPAEPFSLDELASDVVAAIAELEPGVPTVLIGLSLGGMVAQLVASREPDLVHALVLADTVPGASETMRNAVCDRAERTEAAGMAGVLDETVTRWFSDSFQRDRQAVVAQVRAWLRDADPIAHAWTWRAIGEFQAATLLPRLNLPALVVCGSEDASTPPSAARSLAKLISNSTYAEIPGAAHMAPIERPREFVDLVEQFISTTRACRGRPSRRPAARMSSLPLTRKRTPDDQRGTSPGQAG